MRKNGGTMYRFAVALLALCSLLWSCAQKQAGPPLVGIINDAPPNDPILTSFKTSMTEAGYEEGISIRYLYNGYAGNGQEHVNAEVRRVLAGKPRALLALGSPSIRGILSVTQEKMPATVFATPEDPVAAGFVQSLRHPGGRMTGICARTSTAKILEWLRTIAPGMRKVFVPYDPSIDVSLFEIRALRESRIPVDFEVTPLAASFPDGVAAALATMPKGSAIFIIPTPHGIDGFVKAAMARGIPIFSYSPPHLEQGALFTFSRDFASEGRQAARLMGMVLKGVSPGEMPVETADYLLSINLEAAAALHLHIDNEVLKLADRIVR
jgi:putative ABC transport system substrate-binding protein